MKEEDIIKFFTEGQEDLLEAPPPELWDRLDRKLNNRRTGKRILFFRRTAIAASIALILGMITTLPVFKGDQNSNTAEIVSDSPLTAMTEEVDKLGGGLIMTHEEQSSYKNSIKNFKDYNKVSIEDKKQLALVEKPSDAPKPEIKANTSKLGVARTEIKEPGRTEESKIMPGSNYPPSPNKKDIVTTPERVEEISVQDDEIAEIKESPNPQYEEAIVAAEVVDELDAKIEVPNTTNSGISELSTLSADKEIQDTQAGYESKKDRNNRERFAKAKQEKAPKVAASRAPTESTSNTIDLDLAQRSIDYTNSRGAGDSNESIQQLKWILGKWSDPSGKSYETWTLKDELTIEGKGFFIVNEDTLFTERMSIRQLDDKLYFIVVTDDSQQEKYFRLKSMQNYQAIFEDENAPLEQVILQKNSDNSFVTIYQNQDIKTLNESQQNFLDFRNNIQKNRASRSLNRVNH